MISGDATSVSAAGSTLDNAELRHVQAAAKQNLIEEQHIGDGAQGYAAEEVIKTLFKNQM